MKKSILLFSAILLTVTAFAFVKWNETNSNAAISCNPRSAVQTDKELPFYMPKPANLYYDIGSRFKPMKKSKINKSLLVKDFLNLNYEWPIKIIEDVNIILIKDDKHSNIQFASYGEKLSKEQIKFLKSCKYSTNLKLQSKCMVTDRKDKNPKWQKCIEHFSIVPEQQASYSLGKTAFIEYLREGNKKNTYNLDNDKLGMAKLTFTVGKDGRISNLELDNTSGYEHIDYAMLELLKNAPGKWLPAKNKQGETVDQELVVSFGRGGC